VKAPTSTTVIRFLTKIAPVARWVRSTRPCISRWTASSRSNSWRAQSIPKRQVFRERSSRVRAVARLNHPTSPGATTAANSNGVHYFAMESSTGPTGSAELLKRGAPSTEKRCLDHLFTPSEFSRRPYSTPSTTESTLHLTCSPTTSCSPREGRVEARDHAAANCRPKDYATPRHRPGASM